MCRSETQISYPEIGDGNFKGVLVILARTIISNCVVILDGETR